MCHVLIIEDEWLIADFVEHLARDAGATSVATADCQAEAVDMAIEHKPEIILSDVNLRAGTGPGAVAAIVSRLGQIPVIFITATPGSCTPCDQANVILTKPIDARAFHDAFRRLAPPAGSC